MIATVIIILIPVKVIPSTRHCTEFMDVSSTESAVREGVTEQSASKCFRNPF